MILYLYSYIMLHYNYSTIECNIIEKDDVI